MKKTISLTLIALSVLSFGLMPVLAEDNSESKITLEQSVATSSSEKIKITTTDLSGLEKIPSPSQINLYNRIKKVGVDLYGVRKASSTIANIQKNANLIKDEANKKIEEAKRKGLIKIAAPDQMKLFENITKIGNDLFGLRKKGSNLVPAVSAEVKECVAKAIGDKDDQIIKEIEENATNIVKLVEERSACHKAALELASEREAAVTTCNNKFQEGIKNTNRVRQENQKKYWNAYNEQMKACGQKSNSEIYIQDGGEILN